MNPYKMLRDLLPDPALEIGTVDSISNDIATVSLPGGGTLLARGETTVGARVFVRNGVIEGRAPDLTQILIEV